MTTILAFDTSQQCCSIAIAQDGTILTQRSEPMAMGQSEVLVPALLQALADVNLKPQDLNKIITITGPGSFTGLRVSLATAQGMGLGLSIPVVGIDAFTAYASCVFTERNILVVIDSQKQDVYCQLFSASRGPLKEPAAINPAHLPDYVGTEPFVLIGTGINKILPILDENNLHYETSQVKPDQICRAICLLAELPHENLLPIYLKDALVTKPTS